MAQIYVCDECSEPFEEPFFQVLKSGAPDQNVEHIHPRCMIWAELESWLKSRGLSGMESRRVEIQLLIPTPPAQTTIPD